MDDNRKASSPTGKKPYSPPTLTEYGSVAKLTQSGSSPALGDVMGPMAPCL